jgi:hypothetical protein
VAQRIGVDFDNSSLAPVTLNDVEGVPHRFEIRSRLVGTGHVMDAIEIQEGQPRRYRFSVLGDFEADVEDDFRMPSLVIDGKQVPLGRGGMLMSYEGFTVDLRIRDTIDGVGGPLLDKDE